MPAQVSRRLSLATILTTRCGLAVATLLCATITGASDAEVSPLGGTSQPLDQILPESAIAEISLPESEPRLAARPGQRGLDWRPGKRTEKPQAAEAEVSEQKEDLPEASAPMLVAPNSKPTASVEKAEEKSQAKPNQDQQEAKKKPAPKKQPTAKKPTAVKPAPKKTPQPPSEQSTERAEETPSAESESETDADNAPQAQPPDPLSRSMRNLRSRMRTVLSFYYRKPFNTAQYDPWEIMHGMLAYELHSRVRDGGPRSRPITAIGHLCFNRPSKNGQRMIHLDAEGRLDVRVGVGLQGHKGQLMAMLAQCNVSPDYPIKAFGRDFTIEDLVTAEQRTCYAKTELTFKLIGLGHYLDSDARWVNDQGEAWDIPRLIEEERKQPIRGAACGGTHRLSGLSLAYRRREARGEPIDGEYAEAAKFVSQYQTLAFRLQNPDGSLSTQWFRGPGREEDIERRLRTTGHTLEWLAYSLPDDQMTSYPMVRAATFLTNLLARNANQEWHPGSLAHALHALVVYDKRVFQPHDERGETLATRDTVDPKSNLYRGYSIYRGVMRNGAPQPGGGFFGLFGGNRQSSRTGGYRN